jgi:hypothetical protein
VRRGEVTGVTGGGHPPRLSRSTANAAFFSMAAPFSAPIDLYRPLARPAKRQRQAPPSGAAAEALRSGTDAGGAGWAFEVKWDSLRPLVSTEDWLEVCSRAAARPVNSSVLGSRRDDQRAVPLRMADRPRPGGSS